MGLRDIALADNKQFLNDDAFGFGYKITVTDIAETSVEFTGYSNDIGTTIDADTGQPVAGRTASIALHTADIIASTLVGLPVNIADETTKPWRVDFLDINGVQCNFKVVDVMPDRALGMTVCILTVYDIP